MCEDIFFGHILPKQKKVGVGRAARNRVYYDFDKPCHLSLLVRLGITDEGREEKFIVINLWEVEGDNKPIVEFN